MSLAAGHEMMRVLDRVAAAKAGVRLDEYDVGKWDWPTE
jgi:hypothetical protein